MPPLAAVVWRERGTGGRQGRVRPDARNGVGGLRAGTWSVFFFTRSRLFRGVARGDLVGRWSRGDLGRFWSRAGWNFPN